MEDEASNQTANKKSRKEYDPGLWFAVSCVLTLVIGIIGGVMYLEANKMAKLRAEGMRVTAAIIGADTTTVRRRDSDGDTRYETRYFVTVMFEHPKGGTIQERKRTGSSRYRENRDATPLQPNIVHLMVHPEEDGLWAFYDDAQKTYRTTLMILSVFFGLFAIGAIVQIPLILKRRDARQAAAAEKALRTTPPDS
jgi:hypothetical protein